MHLEQVKIVLDKLDIFPIKYANAQLFIFRQKEIWGLLKKNIFKVVTFDKMVIPKEVSNSI